MRMMLILAMLLLTACSSEVITPKGEDFFTHHSLLQLLGWAMFPRIMFWFFSAITGGFFFWVGVLFVPHIMVAFWATTYYWDTNPVICVIAWIIALTGESAEKSATSKLKK